MVKEMPDFFRNKKIFITGHTGFKGTWLCEMLIMAGADLTGYSLEPPTEPSLFDLSGINQKMKSITGDIRDFTKLKNAFEGAKPEIVFHLAAQPIVRTSYEEPLYTYETNVMGTLHLLECIRLGKSVKSFVNITTDKVYDNKEWDRGYKEDDNLNGFDPYSNSKSCSELVTSSYVRSFLKNMGIAVSTVRAGNVIGGGDFARDRIIPDCIRAAEKGEKIIVRNPYSIRPYQHVIEPLNAYLMIAAKQYEDINYAGSYNVGPDNSDCITTGEIATLFCKKWGDMEWENKSDGGPHEAGFLKLDCSKLKNTFGWSPKWNIDIAVERTVEWAKAFYEGADAEEKMKEQIGAFFNEK